jgi:hypothetical protein
LLVLAPCACALWKPVARRPLGLLALLATGGVFAYFGQSYQTGADPWQLFALWAAISLPLCLGVRGDLLWTPWVVLAFAAISLWLNTQAGFLWRADPGNLADHVRALAMALAAAIAVRPPLQRYTGAGLWAARTALTLCVSLIVSMALEALFAETVGPMYGIGLAVLVAAGALLALPRSFDLYGLCVAALAIDVLLVCRLAWSLFDRSNPAVTASLLLLAFVAAGLLTASVLVVLALSRRYQARPNAAMPAQGERT